jgi:hypothetical protein
MRPRRPWLVGAATSLIATSALPVAGGEGALQHYSLLDVMVWDANLAMDATAYGPNVRAEIEQLRRGQRGVP